MDVFTLFIAIVALVIAILALTLTKKSGLQKTETTDAYGI